MTNATPSSGPAETPSAQPTAAAAPTTSAAPPSPAAGDSADPEQGLTVGQKVGRRAAAIILLVVAIAPGFGVLAQGDDELRRCFVFLWAMIAVVLSFIRICISVCLNGKDPVGRLKTATLALDVYAVAFAIPAAALGALAYLSGS